MFASTVMCLLGVSLVAVCPKTLVPMLTSLHFRILSCFGTGSGIIPMVHS